MVSKAETGEAIAGHDNQLAATTQERRDDHGHGVPAPVRAAQNAGARQVVVCHRSRPGAGET